MAGRSSSSAKGLRPTPAVLWWTEFFTENLYSKRAAKLRSARARERERERERERGRRHNHLTTLSTMRGDAPLSHPSKECRGHWRVDKHRSDRDFQMHLDPYNLAQVRRCKLLGG